MCLAHTVRNTMRRLGSSSHAFSSLLLLVLAAAAAAACQSADEGDDDSAGALTEAPAQPTITRILSDGQVVWQQGQTQKLQIHPQQELTLEGANFGAGPDKDLAKIVIGNSRALERDINVYQSDIHLTRDFTGGDIYDEKPTIKEKWATDIVSWTDSKIVFKVPQTVTVADNTTLVVQVQKYNGVVKNTADQPYLVSDPLTAFISKRAEMNLPNMTIGIPGQAAASKPIAIKIDSPNFEASRKRGEAIFWAYDYNLGVAQMLAHAGWDDIFAGRAKDPVTGRTVSPTDFGSIYIDQNVQVPQVARESFAWQPYPIPNPVESLLANSLKEGNTKPTGWVGYVWAEGKNPLVPGLFAKGEWIGFNCASCHGRRIDYEAAPGQQVAKVFTGLPNHKWNAKWVTYSGKMKGLKGRESAPGGKGDYSVDKTMLFYHLPDGTAEASMSGEPGHGAFANDFNYSPVSIPNITRHTPLRRSLSRTEAIVGFEGSYLHPQAPEGTMGPMRITDLKDLTTYMATLDQDHDVLVSVGMYEWLKHKNKLAEIGNIGQGQFVQMGLAKALTQYGDFKSKVDKGAEIFKRDCQSCHQSNFGMNTDEQIMAFTDVGSYFSPSLWNRDGGGIRTAQIRELYWVQGRGLLHDGHLRSADPDHVDSSEMLIDPARCDDSSDLYKSLYQMNSRSFRVLKGNRDQEAATRMQGYFVDFPADGVRETGDESNYLYWDYQSMRTKFGPREFGASAPVKPLPPTPHPWCAKEKADVDALLHYLFTL